MGFMGVIWGSIGLHRVIEMYGGSRDILGGLVA